MKTKIIRSKRKTISLQIMQDGSLLVRAPQYMPAREIDKYIKKNREWIENTLSR